jgi:flagellar protein FlgJ
VIEEILRGSIPASSGRESPPRLKQACVEFESIFLTCLLKTARSAMGGEGVASRGHDGRMIEAMFDENLAAAVARGGGIGLAELLLEGLGDRSGRGAWGRQ